MFNLILHPLRGPRYITRAPLRLDAVEFAGQSQVKVRIPFDPRTGQRELFLDELELIRRLCAQIPDPRQHMVHYYGHYANRARGARGESAAATTPALHDTPTERARRRSWARLLKRVFEIDPLLCPQCGVEMRLVAVIGGFSVVDRILAHLQRIGGNYSSWATRRDGAARAAGGRGFGRWAVSMHLRGASRSCLRGRSV